VFVSHVMDPPFWSGRAGLREGGAATSADDGSARRSALYHALPRLNLIP